VYLPELSRYYFSFDFKIKGINISDFILILVIYMRIYAFGLDDIARILGRSDILSEGVRCPSCGYRTSVLYVLADSYDEAVSLLREGYGLCGQCMIEMLYENSYEIYPSGHYRGVGG